MLATMLVIREVLPMVLRWDVLLESLMQTMERLMERLMVLQLDYCWENWLVCLPNT